MLLLLRRGALQKRPIRARVTGPQRCSGHQHDEHGRRQKLCSCLYDALIYRQATGSPAARLGRLPVLVPEEPRAFDFGCDLFKDGLECGCGVAVCLTALALRVK